MTYKVIAPLVIVKDDKGAQHHLYEGAVVFSNADPDHLEQLLDSGMVEEFEVPAEPEPEPDAPPVPLEEPKKSASKADWVEYAVSKGADRAEAEAANRDDLVVVWGSK